MARPHLVAGRFRLARRPSLLRPSLLVPHSITAEYGGAASFEISTSGALTQTVNPVTTAPGAPILAADQPLVAVAVHYRYLETPPNASWLATRLAPGHCRRAPRPAADRGCRSRGARRAGRPASTAGGVGRADGRRLELAVVANSAASGSDLGERQSPAAGACQQHAGRIVAGDQRTCVASDHPQMAGCCTSTAIVAAADVH